LGVGGATVDPARAVVEEYKIHEVADALYLFTGDRLRGSLLYSILSMGLGIFGHAAAAAELSLVAAPRDFALKEPVNPPPPGGPFTYATSGGTPNWHIVAWDIPGGKLPPFVERKVGETTVFSSRAAEAAVEFERSPDGRVSYRLSQDGSALPCEDKQQPFESDLFAAPNDADTKPPEGPGLFFPAQGKLFLSSLARLTAAATVTINSGRSTLTKGCGVSQGTVLISVILSNAVSHQTLFYRVDLTSACGPQPTARTELCARSISYPRAVYYFRTNPFGVQDPLPMFGQRWVGNNERRTVSLDLLPRLIELIKHGPPNMDHDPGQWYVGHYYNGQHIWGDLTMSSQWEDIKFSAESR
jgi:hypothetical protein